jgi:hypothetical protein
MGDQRFPEVAVERRYSPHADGANREVWVCRAPSEAHVKRWADATCIAPVGLRHVDALVASPAYEPNPEGDSMSTVPTTAPARHLNRSVLNVLIAACLLAAVIVVSVAVAAAVRDDAAVKSAPAARSSAAETARYTSADAAEHAVIASAAASATRYGSADAAERTILSSTVAEATLTPSATRYGSADAAERRSQAGS